MARPVSSCMHVFLAWILRSKTGFEYITQEASLNTAYYIALFLKLGLIEVLPSALVGPKIPWRSTMLTKPWSEMNDRTFARKKQGRHGINPNSRMGRKEDERQQGIPTPSNLMRMHEGHIDKRSYTLRSTNQSPWFSDDPRQAPPSNARSSEESRYAVAQLFFVLLCSCYFLGGLLASLHS